MGPVASPVVRELLPHATDAVDLLDRYRSAPRPPHTDRPWLAVNMVASADGAATVDGVSGSLGGAPDRAVFRAVRSIPDVVLVGAGTVRAESYGPPQASAEVRSRRLAAGQAARPRLAVVTARLDLDPTLAIFDDPDARPLVVVPPDAATRAPDRLSALRAVAEVIEAGTRPGTVDLTAALVALRDHADVVLAEGGPSLNGDLTAADLIDEVLLTVAPTLVGGPAPRIVRGPGAHPQGLVLDWVLEEEGVLFLRYLRPPG